MKKPEARFTGVWTVAIPVRDQERAVAFYSRDLGFEKRFDQVLDGGLRWIELAPPGSSTSVALIAATEGAPAGVDTGIRFTVADADGLHRDLTARSVKVDPLLRWDGVPPMFSFRDPDGNVLYAMEPPNG